MTLGHQGSGPDQPPDESPNESRPSRSAVSAAHPATPGRCGMGLTPYSGVFAPDQRLTMPSRISRTGGVR